MNLWETLHFLRPHWLWALLLLPAAAIAAAWWRRRRVDWQAAVDPHLLPHLLEGGGGRRMGGGLAVQAGLLLAVLALAGPSWRQVEQPLWEAKTPLVLVLDLSSRIEAADLPPSRLLQARAKLAALLKERQGGEVALVAYAGEPFTVAPLTDDAANVALFLDALVPGVMPVDGQDTGKALAWAGALLEQASAREGDILLLSDGADAAASAQATRLRAAGFRVSALGLGSLQGAAYRSRDGRIERAWLDEAGLQALAGSGGGRYARITSGNADLQSLDVLKPRAGGDDRRDGSGGRSWEDQGYWLLPPLLLLALLAFRRPRRGLAVLLPCLLLPLAMAMPAPASAAEPGGWWQRADQRQHQRLLEGVDAYRKGDFAGAQRRFEGIDSDQGWYNLGNALARQGRYDEAIAAYDRALQKHPGMEDALANRAAVDAARKRQSPQGQQGKPQDQGQQKQPDDAGSPKSDDAGQASDEARQPPRESSEPSRQPERGDGQRQDAGRDPRPQDSTSQQQADQAQRERMAEALRQQQQGNGGDERTAEQAAMTPAERERRQAVEAWMQRVPDEPGDLLKTKFQIEYERRRREGR